MVVRRTETREFGLANGWLEEDGTTTTYQPHARAVGARTLDTPAARTLRPSALAPAMAGTPSLPNLFAHGTRKLAAPASDELDQHNNPSARRRGATSASVWSALGFAALFASVLIGRVIVHAGQEHPRAAEARTGVAAHARGLNVPQPAAASARVGAGGVGAETPSADRRNEAALAAPEPERGSGRQPNHVASEPEPSAPANEAQPLTVQPTAAELPARASSSGRSQRARTSRAQAESSDWRVGPMEPAQLNDAAAAAPLPAATASRAALGTLRINSRPWSQVFLDGRLIGTTPQLNVRVPAGRYSVRLANPELGMSKTFVVHVTAGELVTRVELLE